MTAHDPVVAPELEPFLDAVVTHVAFGLGADPANATAERLADARRAALTVLADCGALGGGRDTDRADAAARLLLAHPPLLAAFFQNLDLLYHHGAPGSTEVSLLLMRVMEL